VTFLSIASTPVSYRLLFTAYQPKVYHATGTVAFWTQPIGTSIDFMRATFRTAIETGDLTFACYGMNQAVTCLLLRSDPLDAVWRESQMALDFTCVLLLFRGDEPRIVAEATTGDANIEVTLRNSAVTPAELIESVLHTALRTRESVILDDASARIPFSADEYVRQKHARSVLCLPLVKQRKLVGALYLENNLTPRVFTSAKLAVLTLLASQSAISLEYVRLYEELQRENSERKRAEQELRRSDSYLSEAQRLSHTGSVGWRPSSREIYWSEETFRIFEFDPATTEPTVDLMMRQRSHPEDVAA
jgi:transcriptional regulator with GAF, ATPase, and Fis domain